MRFCNLFGCRVWGCDIKFFGWWLKEQNEWRVPPFILRENSSNLFSFSFFFSCNKIFSSKASQLPLQRAFGKKRGKWFRSPNQLGPNSSHWPTPDTSSSLSEGFASLSGEVEREFRISKRSLGGEWSHCCQELLCCQKDIVTLMKLFFPAPGVFYLEVAPCYNM